MDAIAKNILGAISERPCDVEAYRDLMSLMHQHEGDGCLEHASLVGARRVLSTALTGGWATANELEELASMLRETLVLDARFDLDAFMQAMEFDRAPESRLWLPRRGRLMRLCRELQWFEASEEAEFLSVSLPPRTGKSSICGMFMAWHAGLHPEHSNLMTAHSDKLTKHFYVQELQYVSDPEYNFSEIFPGSPLVWKSSEDEAFSLRKHTAYPTVTCRSVEGTLTGAVEVGEGGVLYSDDLVKDLEEAMSPRRLEAKWEAYVNQCYDRRKKGAKQLMVGTRWDVADPMGRMTGLHEGERGFHVLTIPALDPHTGESNFDYLYGVGFDRRYYLDMRKTTDEATYAAKYDGAPRVRQGQLYSPETLERYLSLPPGLPSKVVAVVDTKGTGEDYCAMPVAAKWDSSPKWFVIDAVCDNSSPKTVNQLLVNCIERNNVNQVSFESNSGGGKVAEDVEAILKSDGHLCSIHKKFSGSNKETRILASSPWVIGTCVFKDSSLYEAGSDYERFMNQMFSFVLDGKNAHDDAPDSMSMLADFLSTSAVNRATAVRRPF